MKSKTNYYVAVSALCVIGGGCQSADVGFDLPGGGRVEPARVCVPADLPESPHGPPADTACGGGGRITYPIPSSLNSFVADGGVGSMAFDFSRSNIPIPSGHVVEISTLDSSGQVIATASFPATSIAKRITLDNPTAVGNWLLSHSSNAYGVEFELQAFGTVENEGENVAIVEIELDNNVILSKGDLWTAAGCHFSGSEACSAGY